MGATGPADLSPTAEGAETPDVVPTDGGTLAWLGGRPRLAALLGAMCISFSGIFYEFAAVSPSTGTVFRALFGLPLLGFVAWLEHRRFGPLPARTVRLALLAGVFFAGDLLCWHHAIAAVGAGLATVLGNLQVLVVGERPSNATFTAVPIVLVGVVLISGVVGAGAYGADPVLGVVLGLATACFYGGYLLTIRIGGRDVRRPAGPVAIATVSTAAVATVIGLIWGDLDLTPGLESLFWLAILGLTSQSLGYLLISVSLSRLPAVLTSIILLAQPVMTVGLAMVLLHESPSPSQLLGVALVVGGIAVATIGSGRIGRVRNPRRAGAGA
jgi:drug/metabolite transporter (DMT)-like permease